MWKLLQRLLGDTRFVGWIMNYSPIAAAIVNAGTYSDSLQYDYTAVGVNSASMFLTSAASAAKNYFELNGSTKLEQQTRAFHTIASGYLLEAGDENTMPPLPSGLAGTPYYNRSAINAEEGCIHGVAQRDETNQMLLGITHYSRVATGNYISSVIVGPIIAAIVAYRLEHCNRDQDPDSDAPECYNGTDITLIGVIMATMFIQTFNHGIIAHGLRDWRTALDESMWLLNDYVKGKISGRLPTELKNIADIFHRKTSSLLSAYTPNPTPVPILPPNIFQSFNELAAFIDVRTQELKEDVAAVNAEAVSQHQKQVELYKKRIKHRDDIILCLQQISQSRQTLSNLRGILETMKLFIMQNGHIIQYIVQESTRAKLANLTAREYRQRTAEPLQRHYFKQVKLELRLRRLTTPAVGGEIAATVKHMIFELTEMIQVLKRHPTITPRPHAVQVSIV